MIVALSRFTIGNDRSKEIREAFCGRPHWVDHAPGFLGMEVMSPLGNANQVWLPTRWSDEEGYRTWPQP